MNCKYCGAALPTKGGVCPECGRIIPMDQQKQMREMLDPKWNDYRDPNTAMYKKESAYDPNNDRVGKTVVLIIVVLVIIVIIAIANAGK
jgi:predicted nucleic acid-binding Zn ribbon protein